MRIPTVCFLIVMMLSLNKCTTSYILHSWKYEKVNQKKYSRILVVCLMNRDLFLREQLEDHLVQDLISHGVSAESALSAYGPNFFRGQPEDSLMKKLEHSGVDGVLTIALLDKEKERYYVPGRVYYTPYIVYHRRFWGYYNTIYDRIYEPGYYQINTNYFWESNFYDLDSKNLIYSVQSKSFDSGSEESMAHDYGKIICSDLIKKRIIE